MLNLIYHIQFNTYQAITDIITDRSCIAISATFRQPTPAHCASLSTQHIRSSGFSDSCSDGLELTARWTQRSGVWCRQLQTVL